MLLACGRCRDQFHAHAGPVRKAGRVIELDPPVHNCSFQAHLELPHARFRLSTTKVATIILADSMYTNCDPQLDQPSGHYALARSLATSSAAELSTATPCRFSISMKARLE